MGCCPSGWASVSVVPPASARTSAGLPGTELTWSQEHGLVSRLLADASLGARTAGLLALIETPEAIEACVLRSRSQDDARRRAQRCITAVQEALRLVGRGSGVFNP